MSPAEASRLLLQHRLSFRELAKLCGRDEDLIRKSLLARGKGKDVPAIVAHVLHNYGKERASERSA